MSVIVVNTPNLATELAEIVSIRANIALNAPTTFDTLINPCFQLKPTQDCEALILEDFTDYQELVPIDLDNLTINVSLIRKTDCCPEGITCNALTIQPNVKTSFEDLEMDGVYCAIVSLSYVRDELGTLVTYEKEIRPSYKKDCCEKEYKNISRDVWGKMSDIACCIANLAKIGRNTKELKKSYRKLSNLLYLYYNSVDACYEKDKVLCAYNKIK